MTVFASAFLLPSTHRKWISSYSIQNAPSKFTAHLYHSSAPSHLLQPYVPDIGQILLLNTFISRLP